MKKFTFIATLMLALSSLTASAELMNKFFYKIANDNAEGWTLQDAGRMTLSPTKDYLQVTLINNGGRMLNRFFNEDGWVKMQDLSKLPNNTYKFTKDMKMVSNATRTDMEFILLPVGACSATDSRISSHNYHWFNNEGEDYFFRYRVTASSAEEASIVINENPTARGDWPAVTEESETAVLKVGVKYSFEVAVNVAAKTATYSIVDEDGAVVKTGVHNYVCAEDRIGIWSMSCNSANSTVQLSNMGLAYEAEGPFATEPQLDLFWVESAERDYFAQFAEGEVLHWIQLGDAEDAVSGATYENGKEYTVSYTDAMDTKDFEMGEDAGCKIITCTQSGQLKVWTSRADDETNVSDEVLADVEVVPVALPAPVASITNVSAGFGKEYTITADNSEVILKPTITIHYTLVDGGATKEGDLKSGETLAFTGQGTLTLYSWDATHKTECYTRSEQVVINNNVEYAEIVNRNFAISKEAAQGAIEGFTATTLNNFGNSSHWERIYSDQKYGYKEDGTAEAYNEDNKDAYVMVKEGFNYFPGSAIGTENDVIPAQQLNASAAEPEGLATSAAPLVLTSYDPKNDVDINASWYIFPQEGLVSYQTQQTNVEVNINPMYVSDDASKPNFYIIHRRGGYDRPDKGDCNATQVVECGQPYSLYRYDTAICDVRVMAYKGFTPQPVGIEEIAVESVENAPMYNVAGQQVNAAAKGLVIKAGKKFINK